MIKQTLLFLLTLFFVLQPGQEGFSQKSRVRDFGIQPGVMTPGLYNAITDVPGVAVGHKTLIVGEEVRTGVTAILPHQGNIFRQKVLAAVYVGNGYGKLAGSTQIQELGNLETPIILTNTLSVPGAAEALIDYTLSIPENSDVQSVYRSEEKIRNIRTLANSSMSPLFMAVIEATEEAILNSVFAANSLSGRDGHMVEALPIEKVLEIMKKYGRNGIK